MLVFGVHEPGTELVKKSDYERLIREFGAKPFSQEILTGFKEVHKYIKIGLIYAHRDFDKYIEYRKGGREVAIVSGRGPSNYMHLGHLVIFNFIKWLQKELDATVYIPLSDDEKYVFGKVKSLEEAYKYAIDNALDIIALGLEKGKTFFFISSKMPKIYEISVRISRYLTFNTVKATFGLDLSANAGVIFYAAVQAAHILYPTIENGMPVVVPIAMDQDPYMRLTRDVAEKIDVIKPASLYSKYISGLTGEPMSASKPETSIFTSDSPDIIKRKVWMALTGGRPTIKEQRELGGIPDKCVVYEWLKVFVFNSINEIMEHRRKCLSGEIICGECKKILASELIKFMERHRDAKEKAINELEDYFLHEINV